MPAIWFGNREYKERNRQPSDTAVRDLTWCREWHKSHKTITMGLFKSTVVCAAKLLHKAGFFAA